MKLTTPLTVIAAAAIGGTALSAVAFADTRSAQVAGDAPPVTISLRIPRNTQDVATTLDNGREVRTWNYSDGTFWVYAPWVDVRKCTAAPAVGSGRPIAVTHEEGNWSQWALFMTWTANGASRVAATVDLTMTCPASAVIETAGSTAGRVSPPRR